MSNADWAGHAAELLERACAYWQRAADEPAVAGDHTENAEALRRRAECIALRERVLMWDEATGALPAHHTPAAVEYADKRWPSTDPIQVPPGRPLRPTDMLSDQETRELRRVQREQLADAKAAVPGLRIVPQPGEPPDSTTGAIEN
jgi:hypothetical protein